jgi:hypothetical protein
MTLARILIAAGLGLATLARAGAFDSLTTELNAAYSSAQDASDSTNGIVRIWSLLELTPSLGKIDSLYVPSAFTAGSPGGPSRILLLPDAFYAKPLVEILRRQLSTRLVNPPPPAGACGGGDEVFTDCCTRSPYLACVVDERLLGGDSTLPILRDTLYAATAMDLVAAELRQNAVSLSAAELKQRRLKANALFLLLGADNERAGHYLLVELDNALLGKMAFLVGRLESQIAKRGGQSPRLTGTLVCAAQSWRAISSSSAAPPSDWLSGAARPTLRGPAAAPFFWTGLGANGARLQVTGVTADSAAAVHTLFDFYQGTAGKTALGGCFGYAVLQALDQAQPLLGVLRAPEVSGFFANWLFLFGALSVLS